MLAEKRESLITTDTHGNFEYMSDKRIIFRGV